MNATERSSIIMSYNMSQMKNNFFIDKDKIPSAWSDALNLFREGNQIGYYRYSEFENAKSFDEFMLICDWEIAFDDDGNCDYIRFYGEKYSDGEILFEALAPYVKEGSYIQMLGEEDDMWRWVFSDGKVTEKKPTIIW